MNDTKPNKIISPGELSVGQNVTVLNWLPRVHEEIGYENFAPTLIKTTHVDHSYEGDVLNIKAIDLPFIIVEEARKYKMGPFKLDTRRANLMELSEDYVKAMKGE